MGASGTKPAQFPVKLNVYNLAGGNMSDAIISAVAGGGLYHTGLEIDGVEYAFGGGNGKGSGVWAQQPHKLPSCFGGATFKEAVHMGVSEPLTRKDLHVIMHQMAREWRMSQYNMLTRNCHHFTTALCARLGITAEPPEWINQLADKGASIGVSLGIINAPAHARRLSGSTAREHNQTGPPSPLRRGGAKAQARRSAEPTRTRAEGGAIANRDRADTPEQVAFGCV